jgi:hypothetical protein
MTPGARCIILSLYQLVAYKGDSRGLTFLHTTFVVLKLHLKKYIGEARRGAAPSNIIIPFPLSKGKGTKGIGLPN